MEAPRWMLWRYPPGKSNLLPTALLTVLLTVLWQAPAHANEDFKWAAGYNVGDPFPAFSVIDQNGDPQTGRSISGENGYLIQFNRSVVW